MKYIPYTDRKEFVAALKTIYGAVNEEDALENLLSLATEKVSKKWTRAYPNWDLVISQLNILFEEILNKGA